MEVNKMIEGSSLVNRIMKIIPEDPITQSLYIYSLTLVVFFGLLGFALSSWYYTFVSFKWTTLFQGLFMMAIALLSFVGLKQTRNAYLLTKSLYNNPNYLQQSQKIESIDEMNDEFLQNSGKNKKK